MLMHNVNVHAQLLAGCLDFFSHAVTLIPDTNHAFNCSEEAATLKLIQAISSVKYYCGRINFGCHK